MNKKIIIVAVMLLVGISAAIVVILAATAPSGKSPEQVAYEKAQEAALKEKNAATKTVSTEELRMRSYEKRLAEIERNLSTLYENQVKMNTTLTELVENEAVSRKAQKENRAYIASIYQKILSLELQVNNIGGGYSNHARPRATLAPSENIPDPLMGTDKFPESVLPPLPMTPPVPVAPSGASAPIQTRLPEP